MMNEIETRTDKLKFRDNYISLQEAFNDAENNKDITFIHFNLITGERVELYKDMYGKWVINSIYA